MLSLIWFRSDLRIYDNPALVAALGQGSTCAVYCLTQKQWDLHSVSPAKRSLIVRQLRSLSEQLMEINVPLVVLDCGTFNSIPMKITEYAMSMGARHVFFNQEYEVNEHECATLVEQKLRKANIGIFGHHDQCMIPPGAVLNQNGDCYKVFSAFKRAFFKSFYDSSRPISPKPQAQKPVPITSDLTALDNVELDPRWQALWPAGDQVARVRLNHFVEESIQDYREARDIPGIEGTSSLSPYLAVGAISTTQCMQAVLSINRGELDGGNTGAVTWMNELIWREFYRHLLVAFPRLCKFKPFKEETDRLPWKRDAALFEKWKAGETGYPIVDAAMRQLSATGWMHNRLRMVTAMFLTKHLFIDWRLGEQYFMSMLVDGDLASNNGGWQWSASTGVDAVPYFRIFNPTRQSQRFDPKGIFLRQYLPQLAHLDNRAVHAPSVLQAQQASYPLPIVEHRAAVAETKAWFKSLSQAAPIAHSTQEFSFA